MDGLSVKFADEQWELDEICKLNHQTFSDEIKQHEATASGLLIDKFHSENKYIICLDSEEIVGMLAIRDVRPFSLDHKLDNLEEYLPPHQSLCEIRLLTVKPKYRSSKVFYLLFKEVFMLAGNYDFILISGILSQQKLYRSIGFVPFGPLVGDEVKYQPMYSSSDFFLKSRHNQLANKFTNRVNMLPGPVDIKKSVSDEFNKRTESHRSDEFLLKYNEIQKNLCELVKAKNVQIFTGSASLANEVMVAHISTLSAKGLILSNGEFGERLIHQAKCQKLDFVNYSQPLGVKLELEKIEEELINDLSIKWILFAHCETSIGIVNDLSAIIEICKNREVLVCVDCVSSFGILPLKLNEVYMASASSGKAIGSYSGLSMILFNDLKEHTEVKIPVYLDIWYYIKKKGIPFTLNSNSLFSLGKAVENCDVEKKYQEVLTQSLWIKNHLKKSALNIKLFDCGAMHPAIISIELPPSINSSKIGALLAQKNILVNYKSDYLLQLNMIQICLFSLLSEDDLQYFMDIFTKELF